MSKRKINQKNSIRYHRTESGVGLVEILVVMVIIAVVGAIALPQLIASRRLSRSAGIPREIMTQLRNARQQAMSQRVPITFRYDNQNKRITLFGGTYGAAGNARNRISPLATYGIAPGDLIYGRPAGVPTGALGDGSNLTALIDDQIDIAFQADGSVIDAGGNPINRALFIYNLQYPNLTATAISVLGSSGRAKIWRYNSSANAYVE